MTHSKRPRLTARSPVLVTLKLERGMPSLRSPAARDVLQRAFRFGGDRHGLRLVHYSIQSNHIHALVEALDERSLSRRMQGLGVRVARGLNRLFHRTGRVLADRFHARILRAPSAVRNALAYVLCNARKHGARILGIDAYSSGRAFDGWIDRFARRIVLGPCADPIVIPARSWLLTTGWRRHGCIRVDAVPGGRP